MRRDPVVVQITNVVVPRLRPLMSTSVGETTTASAIAGSAMETRSNSTGLTSTADVPRARVTDPSGSVMNCCAEAGEPTAAAAPTSSTPSHA